MKAIPAPTDEMIEEGIQALKDGYGLGIHFSLSCAYIRMKQLDPDFQENKDG